MEPEVMLPLDAERVVTFFDRKYPYAYFFNRIGAKDWAKYFAGVVVRSQNEGATQITTLDYDTAGQEMVAELVTRVDGYAQGFAEDPNWRKLLPHGHLKTAAELLRQAWAVEDDPGPIDPRRVEVRLNAMWGSDEPGKMKLYSGLVHRLGAPSAEHRRKFNRASSETRVIGGRGGVTLYSAKHDLMAGFYDELIESVDGYSVNGEPLASPRIRAEMDMVHKVLAVKRLFSDPETSAPAQEDLRSADDKAKAA